MVLSISSVCVSASFKVTLAGGTFFDDLSEIRDNKGPFRLNTILGCVLRNFFEAGSKIKGLILISHFILNFCLL